MIWGSLRSDPNYPGVIDAAGSEIGPVLEIGGESGGDGGVVHGVVKRLRFDGLEPELLRLLLREAARREPGSRRRRLGLRSGRLGGFGVGGVNVVRFGGPAEEGAPPLGGAGRVGLAVGGGARGGEGWTEVDEIGGHFKREKRDERERELLQMNVCVGVGVMCQFAGCEFKGEVWEKWIRTNTCSYNK